MGVEMRWLHGGGAELGGTKGGVELGGRGGGLLEAGGFAAVRSGGWWRAVFGGALRGAWWGRDGGECRGIEGRKAGRGG